MNFLSASATSRSLSRRVIIRLVALDCLPVQGDLVIGHFYLAHLGHYHLAATGMAWTMQPERSPVRIQGQCGDRARGEVPALEVDDG